MLFRSLPRRVHSGPLECAGWAVQRRPVSCTRTPSPNPPPLSHPALCVSRLGWLSARGDQIWLVHLYPLCGADGHLCETLYAGTTTLDGEPRIQLSSKRRCGGDDVLFGCVDDEETTGILLLAVLRHDSHIMSSRYVLSGQTVVPWCAVSNFGTKSDCLS